jgi:hypothetical protein
MKKFIWVLMILVMGVGACSNPFATPCIMCDGEGTRDCVMCVSGCSYCGGDGEVVCTYCNGTGDEL